MAGNSLNKLIFLAVLVLQLNVSVFAGIDFGESNGARWPNGVIRVLLSSSFRDSGPVTGKDAADALFRALNKWESAAGIEFEIEWSDKQTVSATGSAGDGISLITIAPLPENILLFSNERLNAAAVTRVFRNKQNQITEADIVLNPNRQFSVDGSIATYDLEQVFTHEIGHLIGLDHSMIVSSVMFEDVMENGLFGRRNSSDLSRVDVSNALALYGTRELGFADCGQVSGRLTGRNTQGLLVTAHHAQNGKLISVAETGKDGSFAMRCVPAGSYFLTASDRRGGLISISDLPLQPVSLGQVPIVLPPRQIDLKKVDFDINVMGRDGKIDGGPVVLGRGETLGVLIAGHNIAQKALKFSSSSPLISIRRVGIVSSEFETEKDVVKVEVRSSSAISQGEYSLIAENDQGFKSYIFGGFVVK